MIHTFYAGQPLLSFTDPKEFESWRRACVVGNYEFYNGSYVYDPEQFKSEWGRMDGTPHLIEDIPKELRAMVLLLGS